MPDDAASSIVLAVLLAGLAVKQPIDGRLNRAELLVATDDLDGLPLLLLEQREVPDNIKQVSWSQYAGDESILIGEVLTPQLRGAIF